MIERIKWLDRKFNFDYPVSTFPYILERIQDTPIILSGITSRLPEKLLSRRLNNAWSIKEHIGHITDIEELHEKRLDQLLEGVNMLVAANMTNKKTYLADHNETSIAELLHSLETTRNHFVSRLGALSEFDLGRSATHPRLQQQMRTVDLVYFVAEHDNHHITIIREITREANK